MQGIWSHHYAAYEACLRKRKGQVLTLEHLLKLGLLAVRNGADFGIDGDGIQGIDA